MGSPRESGPRIYRRRRPEREVLHRLLADHLETFLDRLAADPDRPGLPSFVERELRAYLGCGLYSSGFARVRCGACAREILVAFSCKGRGFCPSCCGRRMAELSAHLVDHVLPDVPVRQWVVTFPWRVRFLLARDPELVRAVRRVALRTLFTWYRRRAGHRGRTSARAGAVCVEQRFGSSLQLNVHLHALLLDGVYTTPSPHQPPRWEPAEPPTGEDVQRLCARIASRTLRLLRSRGLIDGPFESDEGPTLLDLIQAASVQGKAALSSEDGRGVERVADLDLGDASGPARRRAPLCAEVNGFSLHAAVHIQQGQTERLERLCRYVARGPLAIGRISLTPSGHVLLRLRKPWRDGTTYLRFEPLAFIERLAALVPRPRVHGVTYHGALASGSAIRDRIVPSPPSTRPTGEGFAAAACSPEYSWPELMKRVFGLDVLRCSHCGGRRQIIALILRPDVIRRILEHVGLPADPTPLAPARAPPQLPIPFG